MTTNEGKRITLRISAAENELLEKRARDAGVTMSELARSALSGALVSRPHTTVAQIADGGETTKAALELIDEARGMRVLMLDLVEGYEALLDAVRESTRIPSFFEYRARARVESKTQKSEESATEYLARLAIFYHALYQIWPTPGDASFGTLPEGLDAKTFETLISGDE